MAERTVTLRRNGGKDTSYTIGFTIPRGLAVHLQHLKGKEFRCELTEEGILFRPVGDIQPEELDLPAWVNGESDEPQAG